jgi:hypothetical protein
MARKKNRHTNVLMTSETQVTPTLEMTDYFFLFTLFLILGWSMDPMQFSLDNITGIKRVPTVFLAMNLAFIVVGRALFFNKRVVLPFWDIIKENRWLMIFASVVVLGSAYARLKAGIEESFLTLGLFIFLVPIAKWYIINSQAPWKLLKSILGVYMFWAFTSLIVQFVFFRKFEVFHSREHMVLPMVAGLLYYSPIKLIRVMGVLIVVAGAIAVSKITAFIVGTITLTYMFALSLYPKIRFQRDSLMRTFSVVAFVLGVSVAVAGSYVAYKKAGDSAPSGNVGFREHTYAIAWGKFKSSPIWGSGFTKQAVVKFDLFTVAAQTQTLPTHSDPLDILAAGGLLAAALWLGGIVPKIKSALSDVSFHADQIAWQELIVHQCFLILVFTGLIVSAFNPIFNIPNTASVYWLAFGCMLSTTQLCKVKVKKT